MADVQAVADRYARSAEAHRLRGEALEGQARRLAGARIASFLAALLAGVLVFDLPWAYRYTWAFVGMALVLFAHLVSRHRGVRSELERERIAERVAREGRARVRRDFDELQALREAGGVDVPELTEARRRDPEHPWAEDLDLWGPRGVRALLGPTPSPIGRSRLKEWLEDGGDPADLSGRQGAVREVAADFDLRERLYVEASRVTPVREGTWTRFVEWLEAPALVGSGGALPDWAPLVSRALPPLTLGLALATALGAPFHNLAWGLPLAVQGILAWRWGGPVTAYFTRLGIGAAGLRRYGRLFAAWEGSGLEDDWARRRLERLSGGGGSSASQEIEALEKALDLAESRASMLYVVFAWALLWDVRTAVRLERWRERAGERVVDWFDALGDLEAAAAVAALAHDNPDWAFAEIDTAPGAEPAFSARGLGHPLLSPGVRRTNDLTLDGPGRFLLVTGSNMSGKSTLLRSIGLAAVLAGAGAPVCATSCRMTPLRTFTSMRLADSLAGGVSLFMAELQRLKALVDAAPPRDGGGPALLYLVDEVLQGTNSEERRIAARRIITHLLGRRAIGAVTTHDLALHEEDGLDAASTKVHFRETIGAEGRGSLTFDYVLRDGLATSRNALKLLEVVGLGEVSGGESGRDEGARGED